MRLSTRVTRVPRVDGGFTVETTTGTADRPPGRRRHRPLPDTRRPGARRAASARTSCSCTAPPTATPAELPDGPVLVVGAGNSGVQIAEELAATGADRRPWRSAADPRTCRSGSLGRDLFWWLTRTGLFTGDRRLPARPPHPRPRRAGHRDHAGAACPGAGVDAAPAGRVDAGHRHLRRRHHDLVDAVVWATGFRADYSLDRRPRRRRRRRAPAHERGVSPVPGLYFLGLPWQHTRGSALLGFVGEDAAWLADRLQRAGTSGRARCSVSRRPGEGGG